MLSAHKDMGVTLTLLSDSDPGNPADSLALYVGASELPDDKQEVLFYLSKLTRPGHPDDDVVTAWAARLSYKDEDNVHSSHE